MSVHTCPSLPCPICNPGRWRERTTPCPSCNDGRTYRPIRWAGEAYGELAEERCDDCGGTGEIEAGCAHCERITALDDEGLCAACADIPDECGFTELTGTHGGYWL